MFYSPDQPLWDRPAALLELSRPHVEWCEIDGIPPVVNSQAHHQLLIAAPGRWLHRQRRWLLDEIQRHLGLGMEEWRFQRCFFADFVATFLHRNQDLTVFVQALPRRKTFRTLYVERSDAVWKPLAKQTALVPDYQFHAACLGDSPLELAYGLTVDSRGLLAEGSLASDDRLEDLWWTKIDVERLLGEECVTETWFCLATQRDRSRIVSRATVPALEKYFDPAHQEQQAAIVSLCTLSPRGDRIQTHCVSISPGSGRVIDIRQSKPTLRYYCEGAPHSHRGLWKLAYGKDERYLPGHE